MCKTHRIIALLHSHQTTRPRTPGLRPARTTCDRRISNDPPRRDGRLLPNHGVIARSIGRLISFFTLFGGRVIDNPATRGPDGMHTRTVSLSCPPRSPAGNMQHR